MLRDSVRTDGLIVADGAAESMDDMIHVPDEDTVSARALRVGPFRP